MSKTAYNLHFKGYVRGDTQTVTSTSNPANGTNNGTKKDDNTTQITTLNNLLTPIQLKIVEILKDNPKASRKNISEILGNISVDGVKYHRKKLQTLGIIKRNGGDFGGSWVIEKQFD